MIEKQTYANGMIEFYRGDWFKSFQRIPEKSVDLALTDPPYNSLHEKQEWDVSLDLTRLETTLDYVLQPSGQVILFADLHLLLRMLNEFIKFKLRCYHVWRKFSAMPISRWLPLPNCEFIAIFRPVESRITDLAWNPRDAMPKDKSYRKRNNQLFSPTRRMRKSQYSTNEDGSRWIPRVLNAPNKSTLPREERSTHPTQKPEILLRQLVKTYSNPGGTVLDPFAGSGSSLLSAWREGRPSIGFELEKKYCQETCRRIEIVTSQLSLLNDTSEKWVPQQETII